MVVLSKIYTKTGDSGETALGNGTRVAKHSGTFEGCAKNMLFCTRFLIRQ